MSLKLRSHGKNMIVWVLLGMLVLGLGGFGISNFGGRIEAIGMVGDTEISTRDYARALQRQMNDLGAQQGRPIGMAEARAMGLEQRVQALLFGEAALTEAARRIGVSVGDQELHREITSAEAFKGMDGKFDREAYRLTIQQEGFTEAEFESRVRADIGRSIVQGAVAAGVPAQDTATEAYLGYIAESRDIAWAEVTEADLAEALPEPTEAELTAFHADHPELFTRAETREITYLWLTPQMMLEQIEIDEATLRAAYDARIDEFVQPEKRMVERLVYPTLDEAEAALAKYEAGASFADLAAERGLTLEDADLGEPTKADLGAAGEAVFALETPGVVGPIETDFGPALFQMNVIIAPQETTFEEVRDELRAEVGTDRARRAIGDMTDSLEDLLAGGATLEQMAEETAMELGTVSFGPAAEDDIMGYEAFREAASKATADDFPELGNLDDGGVFALRLDGVTPAAVIPLDEAREAVTEAWRADALAQQKTARADELLATLASEGKDLAASGLIVTQQPELARGGFVPGAPAGIADLAFAMKAPGERQIVADQGRVAIVELKSINAADMEDARVLQIRDVVERQLSQSLAADVLDYYARAIETEAGIQLDPAAINAVQAQMQ
ncbi:SurA N-terminal domain-containing protein [Pseudothioclava arenosa]|uniref:Parvulin-like PPIase n=1 Tax=Pseudothioclava arenosa TaxID=1795308 RepID=A0A2A4CSL6_9RHOB|nr:SurA N-terminal domain-containing protein [Pseudothioclava arenosa]PCD77278.1 peptidylprolyl isomerase [Pseudothioclava arenosa]